MNRQDAFRVIRNRVRSTPDCQIDPLAIDRPGTAVNVIFGGVSAVAEELEARSVARVAAQLRASAIGDDLDRKILEESWGRLTRKPAAAAVFTLNISRPNANAGSGSLAKGTEILAGGLTFTLDSPIIFGASDVGPKTGSFTCATVGTVGNLAPSQLSGFKSPLALFDASLVLSTTSSDPNVGSSTGGAEKEKDDEFRARAAQWDAGLDRNIDLLAAEALAVPGVAFATAIELLNANGEPYGDVQLYVGDVNGRANAALLARVQAGIRTGRMAGQYVALFGTTPSMQAISLHIGVLDTYDAPSVQASVRAAVMSYVNGLAPGATLFIAGVTAAIRSVAGAVIESSYPTGVISPVADVVASSSATIFRTTSDLVTFG